MFKEIFNYFSPSLIIMNYLNKTLGINTTSSRNWKVYYRSYRAKGAGDFLKKNLIKLFITIFSFLLLMLAIKALLPDVIQELAAKIENFSPTYVFLLFLVSESFLGLLPPDFFIIWTSGLEYSILAISLLAVLSYLGGTISYFIGLWLSHLPFLEKWLEEKLVKNVAMINQWGFLIIVIAALFPLPFSPVCLAAGSVRFPFRFFIVAASFRILRIYIYALVLFQLF